MTLSSSPKLLVDVFRAGSWRALDVESVDGLYPPPVYQYSRFGGLAYTGMISVSSAQLSAWLGAFIWPFSVFLPWSAARLFSGNTSVPVRVKVGLAFVLTLVLAPILGTMPAVEPVSAIGLLILAQQNRDRRCYRILPCASSSPLWKWPVILPVCRWV